jgi:two-component system response regulator QseB
MSPHEFSILKMLLENTGRVLPRSVLEQGLYGLNIDIESNTVEVYIHFLRKKLGEDTIRTVRGVGYIIDRCN